MSMSTSSERDVTRCPISANRIGLGRRRHCGAAGRAPGRTRNAAALGGGRSSTAVNEQVAQDGTSNGEVSKPLDTPWTVAVRRTRWSARPASHPRHPIVPSVTSSASRSFCSKSAVWRRATVRPRAKSRTVASPPRGLGPNAEGECPTCFPPVQGPPVDFLDHSRVESLREICVMHGRDYAIQAPAGNEVQSRTLAGGGVDHGVADRIRHRLGREWLSAGAPAGIASNR